MRRHGSHLHIGRAWRAAAVHCEPCNAYPNVIGLQQQQGQVGKALHGMACAKWCDARPARHEMACTLKLQPGSPDRALPSPINQLIDLQSTTLSVAAQLEKFLVRGTRWHAGHAGPSATTLSRLSPLVCDPFRGSSAIRARNPSRSGRC
jgi:hypothetical protein